MNRHRQTNRAGLILLIVLGMLALFSLLAVTYVVFASNSRSASISYERPKQRGTPPDQIADMVLKQILRGTTDSASPFYGHDLLQDIYANEVRWNSPSGNNVPAVLTAPSTIPMAPLVNNVFPYAESFRGSGASLPVQASRVVDNSLLSLVSIPIAIPIIPPSPPNQPAQLVYPAAHLIRQPSDSYAMTPMDDDFFTGRIVTVLSGPLSGMSCRIHRSTGWRANPMQSFLLLVDLSEPFHFNNIASRRPGVQSLLNNSTALANAFANQSLLINCLPFRGSGLGVVQSGINRTLSQTVNFPLINMSPLVSLLGRISAAESRLGATSIRGSSAEDYDAADHNNWFLSYRYAGATESQDIIPSYHRPAVVQHLYTQFLATSPVLTDINVVKQFLDLIESATLRPLSYRLIVNNVPVYTQNRDFSGGTDQTFADIDNNGSIDSATNPQLLIRFGTTNVRLALDAYIASLVRGPWDVDTDRDNINDSVWLDPNLPLITAADGKLLKAMVAVNIQDQESKLNLNAMGDVSHAMAPYVPTVNEGGFSNNRPNQAQGFGVGPAEISLAHLFAAPNNQGHLDVLQTRYGSDSHPGRIADDTAYTHFKGRGQEHSQFRGPGLPSAIHGHIGIGTDHRGNPRVQWNQILDGMGTRISDEYGVSDPYKSTGGVVGSTGDRFYSLTELERMLRKYDIDSSELPGRMASVFSSSNVNSAVQSELSNLITTYSVDYSSPSLAFGERGAENMLALLAIAVNRRRAEQGNTTPIAIADLNHIFPAEFRLNQKFDINMPLGNGLDNDNDGQIDEPSEVWDSNTNNFNTQEQERYQNNVTPGPGKYLRDKVAGADFTETTTGASMAVQGPHLTRSLYARYLYCLAQAIVPRTYAFPGMNNPAFSGTPPQNLRDRAIRARNLAQWAVNVVDYRDSDLAMTRFAFDEDPFDRDAAADPLWYPQSGRIVWGLEFPELVFSEVLATHDVGVQDTYLNTGGNATTLRDPNNADQHVDQYVNPTGSLLVELYAPRTTGQSTDARIAGVSTNVDNQGRDSLYGVNPGNNRLGLRVDKLSPADPANNIPRLPVWRIGISNLMNNSIPGSITSDHETLRAGLTSATERWKWHYQATANQPATPPPANAIVAYRNSTGLFPVFDGDYSTTNASQTIDLKFERMIWLSQLDPSTVTTPNLFPELDRGSADIEDRVFYNRSNTGFLEGGSYLVIGPPSQEAVSGGSSHVLHFGSRNPDPARVPTAPIFGITAGQQSSIGPLRDYVRYLPSRQRIVFSNTGVSTYDLSNNDRNPATGIRNATWMTAAANVTTTTGGNWSAAFPYGMGVNISLPCPDQLGTAASGYTTAPNEILNRNTTANFPTHRMNSWVDLNASSPPARFPDIPFDVTNPNLQIDISRFGNNADLGQGTIANARMLYLQRLADPERAFHAINNPYITIDVTSTDLTVFSGEMAASAGADVYFSTKARTGRDIAFTATPPRKPTPYSFEDESLREPIPTTPYLPRAAGTRSIDHPTNRQEAMFGHELGYASASRIQAPTLGYLNPTFGTPGPVGPHAEFLGMPQGTTVSGMEGLFWLNRDFASPYELMMVPASSPGQLHQQFTPLALPSTTNSPYMRDPTAPVSRDYHQPYGHLLSFLEGTYTTVSPPQTVQGLDLWRMLELVDTPSRFVGAQRPIPYDFGFLNNILGLHVPPFSKLPTYREPGKININTVASPLVWKGLEGNFDISNRSNVTLNQWWDTFRISRQGYVDPGTSPQQNRWVDPTSPTQFTGVYRNTRDNLLSPSIGAQAYLTRPQNVTLLKQNPPTVAAADREKPILNNRIANTSEPFTAYQPLMRLPNMVTNKSSTFAIRLTIGFFEFDPATGLGVEHVGLNGEVSRHRAIYFVDRSIPVGYRSGEDLNTEQSILLRRFLE